MNVVDEIRDRLSLPGSPFKMVAGGLELAELMDTAPKATPAAFVLVAREVAGENERATGPVLQRIERDILVVLAVKRLTSKQRPDEIETLKGFVRKTLLGFEPGDCVDPLTYIGGEIVEVRVGIAWFEETFSSPYYLTEEAR